MPMEVTGWADVVLPECTYLERWDSIRVAPHRKPAVALRMPATEPLYNSKPAYWMAKELSKRLGLEEYFSWNSIEEMLDWQFKQVGTSLEEMKKIGVKTFERPYDDLYFHPGQEVQFFTNTGKIELYSTDLANEGFDPIPVYTPHEEPPEGFYRLNYGRAPMHTFSRTANNPNLTDLMAENAVWINPKVAKIWGIRNDQYIYLENQDGIRSKFPVKARVTERIRWDSVFMVHGFGHDNKKLSRAYGRGASDSELVSRVHVDPIMGGTGMRGNFVTFRFEPAEKEVES
jgi:thiosulfate reductase / polysulfide reductase chain A